MNVAVSKVVIIFTITSPPAGAIATAVGGFIWAGWGLYRAIKGLLE